MEYFEAQQILFEDLQGEFASPDFYRVSKVNKIALGLRDSDTQILTDVVNHGSEQAKTTLSNAITEGIVESCDDSQYDSYRVVDTAPQGTPPYWKSIVAMQIAFPELYWSYFDNFILVHDATHPLMQELVELCISCLTNKLHPSDYYGDHIIPSDKKPVGRPRKEVTHENIKPSGHKAWLEACQAHKEKVRDAWQNYLDTCELRKKEAARGKAWRDAELDRLRSEMSHVSQQYERAMTEFTNKVAEAKELHTRIKAEKPQREQF